MRYSWRQQRTCSARCNACLYAFLYFAPCCDCCASIRLFLVARFRWCKDLHTGENMAQRSHETTLLKYELKYVRLRNPEMHILKHTYLPPKSFVAYAAGQQRSAPSAKRALVSQARARARPRGPPGGAAQQRGCPTRYQPPPPPPDPRPTLPSRS
jgi:hypothetical protein